VYAIPKEEKKSPACLNEKGKERSNLFNLTGKKWGRTENTLKSREGGFPGFWKGKRPSRKTNFMGRESSGKTVKATGGEGVFPLLAKEKNITR